MHAYVKLSYATSLKKIRLLNEKKKNKNAKLSQQRVDYGDMTTNGDVASCTGSWDGKGAAVGKLGKSEQSLEFS